MWKSNHSEDEDQPSVQRHDVRTSGSGLDLQLTLDTIRQMSQLSFRSSTIASCNWPLYSAVERLRFFVDCFRDLFVCFRDHVTTQPDVVSFNRKSVKSEHSVGVDSRPTASISGLIQSTLKPMLRMRLCQLAWPTRSVQA